MSSLSQRRPRAIEAISSARLSERIGRASCGDADSGTSISRRRLSGVLCHGTFSTLRLRDRLEPMCVGELDQQLIRLDLNPGNVGVDEDRVLISTD